MFLIMFNRRHALPLVGTRLLRPRIDRGGGAECLLKVAGSWPVTRRIRDLDSVVKQTCTQTMRGGGQSMSSFNPRQQACPRMFHDLDESSSLLVPEQAVLTDTNHLQPVRAHELFTSADVSHSRNIQALRHDAKWLHRRIVASILAPVNFPVQIQTIYDL